MAKRESRMNEVRLYSDNLDSDLSKASNTIKSYKKVETTTTTKTVVKSGSKPSRTTVTQKRSTIVGDLGIPRQSKEFLQPPNIKEILAAKEGLKEKYAYSGKVKEKENYLYYVSGIGYVTKDGLPAKDNKPKEIKATKTQPKPARVVGERVTIVIQNKKKEREGGDLVENFQYYESKDIDKNNKESIVVHKRKGDPFYQNIHGKRNSSYTQGIRSRATLEKNEIQSKRIETSTITQTNQYQNKTYNTTKVTKTTTHSRQPRTPAEELPSQRGGGQGGNDAYQEVVHGTGDGRHGTKLHEQRVRHQRVCRGDGYEQESGIEAPECRDRPKHQPVYPQLPADHCPEAAIGKLGQQKHHRDSLQGRFQRPEVLYALLYTAVWHQSQHVCRGGHSGGQKVGRTQAKWA